MQLRLFLRTLKFRHYDHVFRLEKNMSVRAKIAFLVIVDLYIFPIIIRIGDHLRVLCR